MDKIVILDFGSQTTQLIGRRIRDLGVYTEIISGDADLGELLRDPSLKGLILSGSPESVYADGAVPDTRIYSARLDNGEELPLLGICYGLQRMNYDNGGRVEALPRWEYGRIEVKLDRSRMAVKPDTPQGKRAAIFLDSFNTDGEGNFTAWMSHGDTLTTLAPGLEAPGMSATGFPAVILHREKPWYGLQFHPEVTHSEGGIEILRAFTFGVCGCEKGWSMETYAAEAEEAVRERVGKTAVLLLISGGVDSTVAGALLLKTLPPSQVHLMYIDTGLMRKNETETVSRNLRLLGAENLYIIHAEEEFLSALKGLSNPEDKRKAIGDLFITIQEREVARLKLGDCFLAQGTLYTDLIESGKGVGKKARLIKSHHNVGSPLVDAKRRAGKIVEPLEKLYKDEVRALGRLLGVDEEVVRRHPFPGPGLGVRILGEVTAEKCRILREADAIFVEELKLRGLYDAIWQAFAVLLPVRSVGVAGDERKYGWVLALRAITSADGMTADVYPFESRDLIEISTRITNSVKEIGRVTYDISSKPPATIEWE